MQDTGKLPWTLGDEHNVAITVSAYNMKIIKEKRGGVRKGGRRGKERLEGRGARKGGGRRGEERGGEEG